MDVWPMAITIGKDEAALLIAATIATVGIMTLAGRWSGSRATRLRLAREEGEREQKDKDRLAMVEEGLREHLSEVVPLVKEFQDYKVLSEKTALNVDHLAEKVTSLVESNEKVLIEMRDVGRTMRMLLTGEIAWRPNPPDRLGG
jgi:hypothetical protein